jgi:hypothetical protein
MNVEMKVLWLRMPVQICSGCEIIRRRHARDDDRHRR